MSQQQQLSRPSNANKQPRNQPSRPSGGRNWKPRHWTYQTGRSNASNWRVRNPPADPPADPPQAPEPETPEPENESQPAAPDVYIPGYKYNGPPVLSTDTSLPVCPSCKGKGQTTHTVPPLRELFTGRVLGPNTSVTFNMPCLDCERTGRVTPAQMRSIQFQREMWCKCSDRSDHATYHADGQTPWRWCVHKHHWHCNECAKIVQIG